jgi:hypothetical protein
MEEQFNETKFRALLVYVAEQSKDDPFFGATKLNKILYYSDFRAYRELGHSITGADYQKLDEGPAPRQLLPIRRALIAEGLIRMEARPMFNHVQHRMMVVKNPYGAVLTQDEKVIADEVCRELRGMTARAVSDLSHTEPGWLLADYNESISYPTAWLGPADPLTQEETELAGQVAARHELDG